MLVSMVGWYAGGGTYIVGVSKEADASNNTGADVVPSERSLIDLCESKSSSLVGVGDVGKIIIEIMESSIASGSLVHGCGCCRGRHCVGVYGRLG
jgi:hypothetical protein